MIEPEVHLSDKKQLMKGIEKAIFAKHIYKKHTTLLILFCMKNCSSLHAFKLDDSAKEFFIDKKEVDLNTITLYWSPKDQQYTVFGKPKN